MKQAKALSEIHQSCHPRPLRRDELDQFFVDTSDARDAVLSRRRQIKQRLERNRDENTKILLAGHAGCGKSTELVKLAEELAGSFFTVSFSVAQECNLFHVPVEDVLVVAMERLLNACADREFGAELTDTSGALREVYRWFAKEYELEETTTEKAAEAEAGIAASLHGLFVKAKGLIRIGDKRVHQITREKAHRLAALTERCNLLVKEVKLALHRRQRSLLIVIEDLDKVDLEDVRRIFQEQPAVLAGLDAALICTVPIFLHHSPSRGAYEQHFECIELPMLKVSEFDGSPCEGGRERIRRIVRKRVGGSLIEADALDHLIDISGGVLRDVFEVLVVAAEAAESLSERGKQTPIITTANVRYGLNRRKNEYARAISVLDLPEEWKLSVNDLYRRLRELAAGPVRVLPADPVAMVLLKARAVLEYNGEQWFRVHPLVQELLKVIPSEDNE